MGKRKSDQLESRRDYRNEWVVFDAALNIISIKLRHVGLMWEENPKLFKSKPMVKPLIDGMVLTNHDQ